MDPSLLGGNAKPSAPAAGPVPVKKGGNGLVIGATIILIIVLCVVIYWFWFRTPDVMSPMATTTTTTPGTPSPPLQGPPPNQPSLTIPGSNQPGPPVPAPSLQGAPPNQPSVTIPGTPGTPTPAQPSGTPTPAQPSGTPTPAQPSGGVTCSVPNPSNIPNGTYKGKCCNCGMGIDPGVGYDPTALTCDCQTPFNTVSHTTKGIAFCGGRDIYVDQNGRLNC
ncbi:hypothetical protein AR679_gp184 [Yellowstone lake phycodnavirus 1]|uniref:hypothetical protein n=1 Tax=Yellowstone lake phycodnavirus 1 TaxID=1586713 RepID=UPI0006EB2A19|nr:hypothetical protein AR679_gp184 [Yellowstone lake phycodnavirus 1]BAT22210.1 hypothetical protein [Yellowstone lake phycodnavirus 1]